MGTAAGRSDTGHRRKRQEAAARPQPSAGVVETWQVVWKGVIVVLHAPNATGEAICFKRRDPW